MIIGDPNFRKQRKAVASVIATIILFTILFAGGAAFMVYSNQLSLQNNQANAGRQAELQAASLEKLALGVKLSHATDPWGHKGDLALTVNNTGGVSSTITAVFVSNAASGQLVSQSLLSPSSPYLSKEGTPPGPPNGDLNLTLPLTIGMGASTRTMTGCMATSGCDIGISNSSAPFHAGKTVIVSVLTSTGNVFSAQYPQASASPGIQTNTLVITMIASPPQVPISCTACVSVTIMIYNYANSAVNSVSLVPQVPTASVTGTASVSGSGSTPCSPASIASIAAYSNGVPGSAKITCTFDASTGSVGGFASFSGAATGYLNSVYVSSAQGVSNTIQIGGTACVLCQGPFTTNSTYFKDSYCLQKHGVFYVPGQCTPTPSSLTLKNLPNANSAPNNNASSDRYVAYYVQVTNNFNVTLELLQYSYIQTDPTLGGESDFFLVGATSNYNATGCNWASNGLWSCPYFPGYSSSTPTLTAYGGNTVNCAESAPYYAPSNNCIEIGPGKTMTLTFAACAFGSPNWNWGSTQYGRAFDNPTGCAPQTPPSYQTPESTYLSIVLAFMYKGQVFDQQIPFQGETLFGDKTSSIWAPCNTSEAQVFCGSVVYTQYSGTVDYFDFVYNPATKSFTIPLIQTINNNLPHGADGVVYNPQDHKLIVGTNSPNDQSPWFNEVDPNTGAVTTYCTTSCSSPSGIYTLNVMISSDGTRVYGDGDPGSGSLFWAPLNPLPAPNTPLSASTNSLTLSGDDVNLNTVVFMSPTLAYYVTNLPPQFEGQTGHVGILNPTTGVTTCFKTGNSCTVFNGVHGMSYDPFTGDLFVFGSNIINQINPNTGALVATETISALNTNWGVFDQGSVDGFGHLFLSFAGNPGYIYFEDYSGSKMIGTNGQNGLNNFNFYAQGNAQSPTAFNYIDDLAPIVGPGSQG